MSTERNVDATGCAWLFMLLVVIALFSIASALDRIGDKL